MHTHTRLAGAACPLPRPLAIAAREQAARARLAGPRAAVRVCLQVYVPLTCACNTSHHLTHLHAHIRVCLHMYVTLAYTCNTSPHHTTSPTCLHTYVPAYTCMQHLHTRATHHTTSRPATSAPCTLSRTPRGGQADVLQREPGAGARPGRGAQGGAQRPAGPARVFQRRPQPGHLWPAARARRGAGGCGAGPGHAGLAARTQAHQLVGAQRGAGAALPARNGRPCSCVDAGIHACMHTRTNATCPYTCPDLHACKYTCTDLHACIYTRGILLYADV